MAKKTNKTILVIIVLAILYYLYINSKNQPQAKKTIKNACCDGISDENDTTCAGDPDCVCDNSLCLTTPIIPDDPVRSYTACCTVGSVNYDSSCLNDPNCSCDATICQQQPSAHACFSNCNKNGGHTSILTTDACGSGEAINYPNIYNPVCLAQQ
jgi:hypothetical protein